MTRYARFTRSSFWDGMKWSDRISDGLRLNDGAWKSFVAYQPLVVTQPKEKRAVKRLYQAKIFKENYTKKDNRQPNTHWASAPISNEIRCYLDKQYKRNKRISQAKMLKILKIIAVNKNRYLTLDISRNNRNVGNVWGGVVKDKKERRARCGKGRILLF